MGTSPLLRTLRNRAKSVAGLPDNVMKGSELLQVVHYPVRGHYACHHDSSPDSIVEGDVRLATLGVFLNNPSKGGELAFPTAMHKHRKFASEDDYEDIEQECQPTPQCTKLGGLIVQPKKGDAVFWYNSRPEAWTATRKQRQASGFGRKNLIWASVHCGAEVLEGPAG